MRFFKFNFIVARTLNRRSTLNKFLSIVNDRYNIIQQLSRTSLPFSTETFYLLISNSPFPSSPNPGKPPGHFLYLWI